MNKNDLFGEILEQGQGALSDTSRAVKSQLGFGNKAKNQTTQGQPVIQQPQDTMSNTESFVDSEKEKEHTRDVVNHLYGVDEEKKDNEKESNLVKGKQEGKDDDKRKITQLTQSLHQEYYQKLVNPPRREEERPAEKVEREKIEEMQDLQKKEDEKPKPIAVRRAQTSTEMHRGVSG